jgi:N-acetylneuraminate synthase
MSIFLIAEIGINHNGDLAIAKKLIQEASDAGFDAVKFQKRSIDKVYAKDFLDGPRESPWGKTQRDQKMGLEFSEAQYVEIDEFCKKLKIAWSASAWDVDSQKFIQRFNVSFNKVASPMLGHKPLLKLIASEGKKAFVSTGMSTLQELDEVVDIFRSHNCEFELMHCNSTYPMKEEDANLNTIITLRERYNCKVGYSGHESTLLKVCIAAVALGASSIERHITLDRAMYGSDQAASIQTNSLRAFVSTIRKIPHILGTGEKSLTAGELTVREKLRVNVDE